MRTAHTPEDLLGSDPKLETCPTSQPHINVNMFSNSSEADADFRVRRSSVDLFHSATAACEDGRVDSFIYVAFFSKSTHFQCGTAQLRPKESGELHAHTIHYHHVQCGECDAHSRAGSLRHQSHLGKTSYI